MLIPYTDPDKAAQRHQQAAEWNRMGHAVVIGAGVAGLIAARVLGRHFDRVTILEREWISPMPLLPNVSLINGATVTRYSADWEYARLTGVWVRSRGSSTREDLLRADLVVDASGDTSQTPRLLNELGYLAPQESVVGNCGRRRHYERLKRFPIGLLVMGDALCFNPDDRHGLAAMTRQAGVLDKCLARVKLRGTLGIETLTHDFRRSVAMVLNAIAPRPGLFGLSAFLRMLRAAWSRRSMRSGPKALAPETEYGRRLKHGDTTSTGRPARTRAPGSRSTSTDGGGNQLGTRTEAPPDAHRHACV